MRFNKNFINYIDHMISPQLRGLYKEVNSYRNKFNYFRRQFGELPSGSIINNDGTIVTYTTASDWYVIDSIIDFELSQISDTALRGSNLENYNIVGYTIPLRNISTGKPDYRSKVSVGLRIDGTVVTGGDKGDIWWHPKGAGDATSAWIHNSDAEWGSTAPDDLIQTSLEGLPNGIYVIGSTLLDPLNVDAIRAIDNIANTKGLTSFTNSNYIVLVTKDYYLATQTYSGVRVLLKFRDDEQFTTDDKLFVNFYRFRHLTGVEPLDNHRAKLTDLTDVSLSSLASGDSLSYNNGVWRNVPIIESIDYFKESIFLQLLNSIQNLDKTKTFISSQVHNNSLIELFTDLEGIDLTASTNINTSGTLAPNVVVDTVKGGLYIEKLRPYQINYLDSDNWDYGDIDTSIYIEKWDWLTDRFIVPVHETFLLNHSTVLEEYQSTFGNSFKMDLIYPNNNYYTPLKDLENTFNSLSFSLMYLTNGSSPYDSQNQELLIHPGRLFTKDNFYDDKDNFTFPEPGMIRGISTYSVIYTTEVYENDFELNFTFSTGNGYAIIANQLFNFDNSNKIINDIIPYTDIAYVWSDLTDVYSKNFKADTQTTAAGNGLVFKMSRINNLFKIERGNTVIESNITIDYPVRVVFATNDTINGLGLSNLTMKRQYKTSIHTTTGSRPLASRKLQYYYSNSIRLPDFTGTTPIKESDFADSSQITINNNDITNKVATEIALSTIFDKVAYEFTYTVDNMPTGSSVHILIYDNERDVSTYIFRISSLGNDNYTYSINNIASTSVNFNTASGLTFTIARNGLGISFIKHGSVIIHTRPGTSFYDVRINIQAQPINLVISNIKLLNGSRYNYTLTNRKDIVTAGDTLALTNFLIPKDGLLTTTSNVIRGGSERIFLIDNIEFSIEFDIEKVPGGVYYLGLVRINDAVLNTGSNNAGIFNSSNLYVDFIQVNPTSVGIKRYGLNQYNYDPEIPIRLTRDKDGYIEWYGPSGRLSRSLTATKDNLYFIIGKNRYMELNNFYYTKGNPVVIESKSLAYIRKQDIFTYNSTLSRFEPITDSDFTYNETDRTLVNNNNDEKIIFISNGSIGTAATSGYEFELELDVDLTNSNEIYIGGFSGLLTDPETGINTINENYKDGNVLNARYNKNYTSWYIRIVNNVLTYKKPSSSNELNDFDSSYLSNISSLRIFLNSDKVLTVHVNHYLVFSDTITDTRDNYLLVGKKNTLSINNIKFGKRVPLIPNEYITDLIDIPVTRDFISYQNELSYRNNVFSSVDNNLDDITITIPNKIPANTPFEFSFTDTDISDDYNITYKRVIKASSQDNFMSLIMDDGANSEFSVTVLAAYQGWDHSTPITYPRRTSSENLKLVRDNDNHMSLWHGDILIDRSITVYTGEIELTINVTGYLHLSNISLKIGLDDTLKALPSVGNIVSRSRIDVNETNGTITRQLNSSEGSSVFIPRLDGEFEISFTAGNGDYTILVGIIDDEDDINIVTDTINDPHAFITGNGYVELSFDGTASTTDDAPSIYNFGQLFTTGNRDEYPDGSGNYYIIRRTTDNYIQILRGSLVISESPSPVTSKNLYMVVGYTGAFSILNLVMTGGYGNITTTAITVADVTEPFIDEQDFQGQINTVDTAGNNLTLIANTNSSLRIVLASLSSYFPEDTGTVSFIFRHVSGTGSLRTGIYYTGSGVGSSPDLSYDGFIQNRQTAIDLNNATEDSLIRIEIERNLTNNTVVFRTYSNNDFETPSRTHTVSILTNQADRVPVIEIFSNRSTDPLVMSDIAATDLFTTISTDTKTFNVNMYGDIESYSVDESQLTDPNLFYEYNGTVLSGALNSTGHPVFLSTIFNDDDYGEFTIGRLSGTGYIGICAHDVNDIPSDLRDNTINYLNVNAPTSLTDIGYIYITPTNCYYKVPGENTIRATLTYANRFYIKRYKDGSVEMTIDNRTISAGTLSGSYKFFICNTSADLFRLSHPKLVRVFNTHRNNNLHHWSISGTDVFTHEGPEILDIDTVTEAWLTNSANRLSLSVDDKAVRLLLNNKVVHQFIPHFNVADIEDGSWSGGFTFSKNFKTIGTYNASANRLSRDIPVKPILYTSPISRSLLMTSDSGKIANHRTNFIVSGTGNGAKFSSAITKRFIYINESFSSEASLMFRTLRSTVANPNYSIYIGLCKTSDITDNQSSVLSGNNTHLTKSIMIEISSLADRISDSLYTYSKSTDKTVISSVIPADNRNTYLTDADGTTGPINFHTKEYNMYLFRKDNDEIILRVGNIGGEFNEFSLGFIDGDITFFMHSHLTQNYIASFQNADVSEDIGTNRVVTADTAVTLVSKPLSVTTGFTPTKVHLLILTNSSITTSRFSSIRLRDKDDNDITITPSLTNTLRIPVNVPYTNHLPDEEQANMIIYIEEDLVNWTSETIRYVLSFSDSDPILIHAVSLILE